MSSSDEVVLTVKLQDLQKFVSGSRQAQASVRGIGDEADRAGRKSRLASIASGGFGMLRSTLGTIASGAKWVGGSLLAAGTAAAVFGVKTDASFQQAQIGMTTMLHSGAKANAFLHDLQSFANTTPFEFPQLITASQRLLAFGFHTKQILPMLTSIGDAAAGLGLGADGVDRITLAIGQMQAKTKVQGDELLQLTEAGIPALQILAKGLNMSTSAVSKAVSKGQLSAKTAIPILLDGMNSRFGGLMDKQSRSLSGMWSNFHDNLTLTARQAASPWRPLLADWLGDLNKAMPAFRARVRNVSQQAARGLPRLFHYLREGNTQAAGGVVGALMGHSSRAATDVTRVLDALKGLGRFIKDPQIVARARAFGRSLSQIGDSFSGMGGGAGTGAKRTLDLFNGALKLANSLGGNLSWILPALAAGFVAVKASQVVTNSLPWKVGDVATTWALVFSQLALARSIKGSTLAARQNLITTKLAAAATKIWTGAQWLLNAALTPMGLVIIVIAAIAIGLVLLYRHSERFRNIVHTVGRVGAKAFGWIWDKITAVFGWAKKHWPLLLGILTGPIGLAVLAIFRYKDRIIGAFKGIINGILIAWNALDLTISIPSWIGKIPGVPDGIAGASFDLFPDVPLLAKGGTMREGGLAVVGDAGKELLSMPRGAQVTPLPAGQDLAGSLAGTRDITLVTYLDSQVLARSVQKVNDSARARR